MWNVDQLLLHWTTFPYCCYISYLHVFLFDISTFSLSLPVHLSHLKIRSTMKGQRLFKKQSRLDKKNAVEFFARIPGLMHRLTANRADWMEKRRSVSVSPFSCAPLPIHPCPYSHLWPQIAVGGVIKVITNSL